jgi:signal transduction histidine kinase
MSLAFIFLVLVLTADALLGLVVWLQSPRRRMNGLFALLALSFVLWSASGYYDQTAQTLEQLTPLMAGLPFVGGMFIALFTALFALYFPEGQQAVPRTRLRVMWGLVITTLPLVYLSLSTNLIVANVTVSPVVGNNIVPGPLYGLFLLYFLGWMGLALSRLFRMYRRTQSGTERMQLSYVFLGFFLTMLVALITNVLIPLATNNPTASRFGFLATLFLIGFIGYAIAAQRLFNIRLLVARSVAYVLLLTTLSSLYGLSLFGASSLFIRGGLTFTEAATYVVLALVLAVTFQPLRRFFEKITDRIFFRDHYDTQAVLEQTSSISASELLLEPLLEKTIAVIARSMRLEAARFVILEGHSIYTRVFYGPHPKRQMSAEILKTLHGGLLVSDELKPGEKKSLLEHHGIRVALELRTKEETVGYLLLGHKLSGDIYSSQDLALFTILRKELAVAIANARAYEEISRFNVTLQERIHQATQRLKSANRNLKELDKAKDDFISMASHQLGTPLTAITGYLSMTLDDDKKSMTAAQREYVGFALEAAQNMVAMSSDLLNVSRLSSGRFVIQRQDVDLALLVSQQVTQLQSAAGRKNLALTYEAPGRPLPVLSIDESKTRQVVMNFIDNAIYYTERGSITVKVGQKDGQAIVTVTDTGIGVPQAGQAKLFSKFYRADNAKSVRPDGTGLGLYLAKRVIEDQGGRIIFETEAGKGSTFGFSLPIGTPEQPAQS